MPEVGLETKKNAFKRQGLVVAMSLCPQSCPQGHLVARFGSLRAV